VAFGIQNISETGQDMTEVYRALKTRVPYLQFTFPVKSVAQNGHNSQMHD